MKDCHDMKRFQHNNLEYRDDCIGMDLRPRWKGGIVEEGRGAISKRKKRARKRRMAKDAIGWGRRQQQTQLDDGTPPATSATTPSYRSFNLSRTLSAY